jgi:hypothetical protein
MQTTYLILFLLCLLTLTTIPGRAAPPKADFYVATNGDDRWTGRLPAPNRRRTDGPFQTLARAQQAVRHLLLSNAQRPAPVTVLIRGGTHFLREPLVFTPGDSGADEAPVLYAAYPGEKPVLSGGTRLSGWKPDAQGRWRIHLPDVARGAWRFSQLWAGGQRRYRPRLPKQGYYFIAGDVSPSPKAAGQGYDRIQFNPGEIRADWHNLQEVEILGFQIWTMARMRVESVDEEKRIVQFTGRTLSTQWYTALPRGNRYLVENVREALERPGEWYLDRRSGELTYIPMRGENPAKTVIIAPRLERLVELKGDPAKRQWVRHIVFRGLTFAHTNWNTPPGGNTFPQAEVNLGGAFTAVGARDCALEQCRVTHVGTYAVEWGAGCKRCRVVDSELTDMAAGGVKIGTQGYAQDEEQVASHNLVRNCLIAHGGRMHPAAIGVWIGHSPYNTIEHNEIADFYYTGISVGWSWGYGPSHAHHNTLQWNHVHHIGQGVLSDMGATYTLGVAPGTVQRYNRFHDVEAFGYGGWGIYFDEGTTGMLAENNLVYRTKSAGFHQHYGRENNVRNNIFAFGREAQVMRSRAEDHLSFTFEGNIVYWKEGPLLGSIWADNNYKLDRNLYWNAAGQPITFAGTGLESWRAKGQDVHSLIADPLFVDPEKGDFRLKPGSPAEKIGFQPFDFAKAGRLPVSGKRTPVRPIRAFPPPPPPPPPMPIVQDYEEVPVGEKPPGAMIYEEREPYTIRVTAETAATGKRSLKFVDGPGQKANYNPHMFYDPGFDSGWARAAFSLRVEPGTHLYHEWRDASSPYRVGPSLWIAPDGTVSTHGRTLLQIPHGQWIRFEIACGAARRRDGTRCA